MSGFVAAWDYGWPSLRATVGDAEAVLVPEIGGRLMGLRLAGQELLFVNPDLQGLTPDLEALGALPQRGGFRFPLWGGEKTWIAPQRSWHDDRPSSDLDSGPYAVTAARDGIVLTSAVCRRSGLQIVRELSVGAHGLGIRHTLRNCGRKSVFAGPWSVAMLNRDAVFFLPGSGAPAYMNGQPSRLVQADGLTRVDCADGVRFKTGHALAEGWFAAFLPRADGRAAAMVLRCAADPYPGEWAHDHPAEIFNSDLYPYCEMEVHGPARLLAPGDSTSWEVRLQAALVEGMPTGTDEVRRVVADMGRSSR